MNHRGHISNLFGIVQRGCAAAFLLVLLILAAASAKAQAPTVLDPIRVGEYTIIQILGGGCGCPGDDDEPWGDLDPFDYILELEGAVPGLFWMGGFLAGVPTTVGNYPFSIVFLDPDDETEVARFGFVQPVLAAGPLAIAPIPNPIVGEPYSHTISVSGGVGPYIFQDVGGWPFGLDFDNNTGLVSGTPLTSGVFQPGIVVADSANPTPNVAWLAPTIHVRPSADVEGLQLIPPSSTLPHAILGEHYTFSLQTSGGTGDKVFYELAAGLPAGLTLDEDTGVISGTPTRLGGFSFPIQVIDEQGDMDLAFYFMQVFAHQPGPDPEVIEQTFETLSQNFVQQRQHVMMSTLRVPGLIQRRSGVSGATPGSVSLGGGGNTVALGFSSSLRQINTYHAGIEEALRGEGIPDTPFNFWIDGAFTLHTGPTGSGTQGEFAIVSLGGDYLVDDRLLVGLALHGDWMNQRSAADTTYGRGYLAGPYVSVEVMDTLFLDASLYFGQSWNTATTAGFTGDFETRRLLLDAELHGQLALDVATTLSPHFRFALAHEVTGDYVVTDGLGNTVNVTGSAATLLRAGAGSTLAHEIALEDGYSLIPELGFTLGAQGSGVLNAITGFAEVSGGLTLRGPVLSITGRVEQAVYADGASATRLNGRISGRF